jgi:hypothetical protein
MRCNLRASMDLCRPLALAKLLRCRAMTAQGESAQVIEIAFASAFGYGRM